MAISPDEFMKEVNRELAKMTLEQAPHIITESMAKYVYLLNLAKSMFGFSHDKAMQFGKDLAENMQRLSSRSIDTYPMVVKIIHESETVSGDNQMKVLTGLLKLECYETILEALKKYELSEPDRVICTIRILLKNCTDAIKKEFCEELLPQENRYEFSPNSSPLHTLYALHLQRQADSELLPTSGFKACLKDICDELGTKKDDFPNLQALFAVLRSQQTPKILYRRIVDDIKRILEDEIMGTLRDGYMYGFEARQALTKIDVVIKFTLDSYTEPKITGVDTFMKNWIQKVWDKQMPQLQPSCNNTATARP